MARSSLTVVSILAALSLTATAPILTAQGDSSSPAATLLLDVRRVPVDIVVTDKQGNPVRGLKQSDFIVKEDKKPQTILSFDYQDGSKSSYVPGKLPALPTNIFANLPTQPERGPLYILYYDVVNTPIDDQMNAHDQLLDAVDNAEPGARFALFVNARGLHLIQGFTSDRALLHAAIQSKGPGRHLPDVFLYGSLYGTTDAGASLQCLKFIADYVNGFPGRKNLLWLSSIFPIPAGPTTFGVNSNTRVGGGFSGSTPQLSDLTYLLSDDIKKTYAAMMRSQVALYPLDLEFVNPENDPFGKMVKEQAEEDIAAATGGHAYFGGNRLQPLIDKAVRNGESYYALSYAPTNAAYDGSKRSIHVALTIANKELYTLTYRTGYYAFDDTQVQQLNQKDPLQTRFLAAKAKDTMYGNMERGLPILHDLIFSCYVSLDGKPTMATPEQMAELQDSPVYFRTHKKNGAPPKPLKPVALQTYRIRYGVMTSQLRSLSAASGKPADLEFVAAAYDADDRLLNSILSSGQPVPQFAPDGKPQPFFAADVELDVPPGAMWLRLAVRDTATNRTGTLEVRLPLKPETATAMAERTY